jgi:hypothetical protein
MRLRSTRRVASILYATREAVRSSAFHCIWVLHSLLLALQTVVTRQPKTFEGHTTRQQWGRQCELLMIMGQRVARVGQASPQSSAFASYVGHHLHRTSGSERFCDFIAWLEAACMGVTKLPRSLPPRFV